MGAFSPDSTYVQLASNGDAIALVGGETFWRFSESEMEQFGSEWLITEFDCSADWSNWEMHPHGDEFVYLLSGAVMMRLALPEGEKQLLLQASRAIIVPRGVWHTACVSVPSKMLFVTKGRDTQHRPVKKGYEV